MTMHRGTTINILATLLAALICMCGPSATHAQCTSFVDFINSRADLSIARSPEFFNLEVSGSFFFAEVSAGNALTIVVSNNQAFSQVAAADRAQLAQKGDFSNTIALAGVLVDPNQRRLMAADLTPGRVIPTAGGFSVTAGATGGLVTLTPTEGGTAGRLVETDIAVCEGVVHITDVVYIPDNI